VNAEVREIDLRKPEAWSDYRDPKSDRVDENVLISWCGRYTIVRYAPAGDRPESFTVFRRHGPPRESGWSPPSWSESVPSLLAGAERAAQHLAEELAR
jgi:hypothetical protein